MSERFDVVIYDEFGYWTRVGSNLGALAATLLSKVMVGEADRDPTIAKVLIVDADDYTNFLWERGKGIVFPPPEELQKAKEEARVTNDDEEVSRGGE